MQKHTDRNKHAQLQVLLLRHTPEPLAAVALAARLCYRKTPIQDLVGIDDASKHLELVRNVVARGHESVLEHVSFTFAVGGISRACSHQLVRHRLASYSQQSQRYVQFDELTSIIPSTIAENANAQEIYRRAAEHLAESYAELIELGIPAEDARYILPNACTTQIMITMNVRELRHFFRIRLCRRAQWEIREMVWEMLKLCRDVEPNLFDDCGPNCYTEHCREGEQSCGKPWQKNKEPQENFQS